MNIRELSLAFIAALVFSVGNANADVVAIDFGATATSVANYNVSNFASSDITNLVRLSDGASTGISLTVVGDRGDNANAIAGNLGNTSDPTIFVDGISSVGPNGAGGPGDNIITFTFAGLDDSITYDLIGGTARAPAANLTSFVTDWTTSSLGGNGGSTLNSDATATGGYVSFTGLTSTGGSLAITVTDANVLTAVSQIELSFTSVPEPSSLALLALGGLGVFVRRRR